ncbi:hypothetical protein [Neomicrococcus lactis]|uniref:hypothetical protein n=1 Tax=Neomicrococcus lactis TaxID=732241 RepID=UPI002301E7CE|nr:hypothetical protein [Neomicrococcus lactis]
MSAEKKLSGLVAEIVSNREIILNKGSKDGVREGMYFNVLDPSSVGIKDPVTGEDLGGIKRIKITVVAVEVAERITLAQTFRTRSVNVGGHFGGMDAIDMLRPPKFVERVETLRLDPKGPKPLGPSESVVVKGDPFELGDESDADASRSVTVWE